MAGLGVVLTGLSAGMQLIGGFQQAAAIKAAGKTQQQAAEHRAAQLRVNAGQQRASTQRAMIEDKRQGRLAQSRALALGASSGSASDVYGILSDLGAESRYRALSTFYEGEDASRQLESGADLSLYEGASAVSAAKAEASSARLSGVTKAVGTIGGSSLFDKYAPSSSAADEVYGPFRSQPNMARYRY